MNKKIKAGTPQSLDLVFETRVVSEEQRMVDYVASDQNIDRYKTRLKGWKLDNYRRCPVVLFGHNRSMPPIGRALDIHEQDGELRVRVQFAPRDTYEFADTCYKLVRDGFMPGVSVGFTPSDARYDEKEGVTDLIDNELFELSCVPVPGNAGALAKSWALIPEAYRGLFTANRSASVKEIPGVDLEQIRVAITEWVNSEKPQERQADHEAPAPDDDEADPSVSELSQRIALLNAAVESLGEERAEMARFFKTELAARSEDAKAYIRTIAVLKTIAAMVDFDLERVDDESAHDDLCKAVQEGVVRAGAMLNRQNRAQLTEAVKLISGVLEAAAQSGAQDMGEPEEIAEAAPKKTERESEMLKQIQEQISRLASTVEIVAGGDAGRVLVGESRPSTPSPLDLILAKMNAQKG